MRGTITPASIILAIIALATLIALVTTISSLAMPGITGSAHRPNAPDLSPTPTATPESVPGSTDGILWTGFAIAAIVLLPLLVQRALWRNPA